ncbi:RPIA [Enterospora canceri]|uniref:Ribose-5-phosphate isomerase n=1 Tax=Enterospora canceri TaxID=1081671 RepID=A0A1Y1S901_9MICR|nr:RPIA [Enterospora canceri]
MEIYESIYKKHLVDKKIIGFGASSRIKMFTETLPPDSNKTYVPTDMQSEMMLSDYDLRILPKYVDLYVDTTDLFVELENGRRFLVKGLSHSAVKEKILYSLADKKLVLYDSKKITRTVAGLYIPVEIIKESYYHVCDVIARKYKLKQRIRLNGPNPYVNSMGHFVLMVEYSEKFIKECEKIVGVVEHGVFEIDENTILEGI